MPDYSKAVIYSIRSNQTDKIYIGATLQPLYKALYTHKKNYKTYLKGTTHYITSYEIVKFDDVYIELIEEYPCDNKAKLDKRKGEIIRETDNCINKTYKLFPDEFEKATCDNCGVKRHIKGMSRHKQTKKCINYKPPPAYHEVINE